RRIYRELAHAQLRSARSQEETTREWRRISTQSSGSRIESSKELRVSSESELREVRAKKAETLKERGKQVFPNDFRVTDAIEASRRELLRIARDESELEKLTGEDGITEDSPRFNLYGRVMAKRGPFLVIRTPYGDAQALVRKELLDEDD